MSGPVDYVPAPDDYTVRREGAPAVVPGEPGGAKPPKKQKKSKKASGASHLDAEASNSGRIQRGGRKRRSAPAAKPTTLKGKIRYFFSSIWQSRVVMAILTGIIALWEKIQPIWAKTAGVRRIIRRILQCVTPLGWTVLFSGIVAWVAGTYLGWQELGVIACLLLVCFVIGACFTIGRMRLAVSFDVSPRRVTVGNPSMANFEMRNVASRPLTSLGVELPVGQAVARYTTPMLSSGESYSDWVTVPTTKRGVITIGPVRTQRGDPLGMVRREIAWTDALDLFVHPKVAMLDTLGTGLVRDLEGQTTQDVSSSDLAFHALREYVPGDDQRYIHWRSSARISAMAGETKLLVRQFLDTRRSHVVILTDVREEGFSNEDEFELALSCAASVAVRTVADEMDLSIMCGRHLVSRPAPHLALDTYARATFEPVSLSDQFAKVSSFAPDASLVVAVTGANAAFADLHRGRAFIDYSVRLVVIRVSEGAQTAMKETSGFIELTVGSLEALPLALHGGIAA